MDGDKVFISSIGRSKSASEPRFRPKSIKIRVKNYVLRVWRKLCLAIYNTLSEFCIKSGIHGVRHFYDEKWYVKLIFLTSFCSSIIACILIVQLVRYEWLDKPVIVSHRHDSMTIREIPFPAITICPQAKASHKRFDCKKDYEKFWTNLIGDDIL